MSKNLKYAVFGSGSWATAIIKILSSSPGTVSWYVRKKSVAEQIHKLKHNPSYLTSVEIDTERVMISSNINTTAQEADVLIFAFPSAFMYSQTNQISYDISSKVIVSAVKGIIPETGLLPCEYFHMYRGVPYNRMAVIGGPCHAEEIALERSTFLTIASKDKLLAEKISVKFSNSYIRTKTDVDITGAEYAAMLKNIYAIAAGISHGLGYGDNFQSVLISNAAREIKGFLERIDSRQREISSTLYLGDLLVTAYSVFSRNRMLGNMIGKGYTVKSAQAEMKMIAEGYFATKSAYELNNNNTPRLNTPIINAVYSVLFQGEDPKEVFKNLSKELD